MWEDECSWRVLQEIEISLTVGRTFERADNESTMRTMKGRSTTCPSARWKNLTVAARTSNCSPAAHNLLHTRENRELSRSPLWLSLIVNGKAMSHSPEHKLREALWAHEAKTKQVHCNDIVTFITSGVNHHIRHLEVVFRNRSSCKNRSE